MTGSAAKIPGGLSKLKTLEGSRTTLHRYIGGEGGEIADLMSSSGAIKLEQFDILTADGVVYAIEQGEQLLFYWGEQLFFDQEVVPSL